MSAESLTQAVERRRRFVALATGGVNLCIDSDKVSRIARGYQIEPSLDGDPSSSLGRIADGRLCFSLTAQIGLTDQVSEVKSRRVLMVGNHDARAGDSSLAGVGWVVDHVSQTFEANANHILPVPLPFGKRARNMFDGIVFRKGKPFLSLSAERFNNPTPEVGEMEMAYAAKALENASQDSQRHTVNRSPSELTAEQIGVLAFSLNEPLPVYSQTSIKSTLVGIGLGQVEEVISAPEIFPFPMAPAHVLGLAVWRRNPVVVIDLTRCVYRDAPPPRTHATTSGFGGERLVVVRLGNEYLGLHTGSDIRLLRFPTQFREVKNDWKCEPRRVRGLFEVPDGSLVVPNLTSFCSA